METDKAEIAVGSVKDKLNRLLSKEAHLLQGIRQDISRIKDELHSTHALLKYAANTSMDGEVKPWPEELKEVALQIEILIDNYTFKIAQLPHWNKYFNHLLQIAHSFIRYRAAPQIANIKSRLSEIKKKAIEQQYDSEPTDHEYFSALARKSTTITASARSTSSRWQGPRMNPLYLKKPPPEAFVGLKGPVEKLAGLLLDKTSPIRTVVAVVGKGGLGKTTLAQKVYDEVKAKFDCYAWITVSQPYTKEELVRKLFNNFYHNKEKYFTREEFNITNMGWRDLQSPLRSYLQHKRYFVVLVGVLEIDFLSDIIEHAFIDYKNGSRIMITTRNEKIEDFYKISSSLVHVYELQPLSVSMATELFLYKIFRYEFDYVPGASKEHKIHRNIQSTLLIKSSVIVEMCKGLPLAISVVAGLLSTKNRNLQEWEKALKSPKPELRPRPQLPSPIHHILNLCFNDLPYHLKSCFLYFGVFPKGYWVRCSSIFRQWIAEGFVISTKKHKRLEAVAREYLIELARRGLIEWSMTWSRIARSCTVHSLVHEFIVSKMDELNFCQQVVKPENSSNDSSNNQLATRRLSLVNMTSIKNGALGSNNNRNSGVRGIFIFNIEDGFLTSKIHSFIRYFNLLNILIFDDAPIDHLPEDLGDLFHLGYLSMRNTKVKMLPKSIGKLQNLETLDLRETQISCIPREINRLPKLKYLLVFTCDPNKHRSLSRTTGVEVQKGIGSLKTLCKLYHINVTNDDMLKELGNLTSLRKLGIIFNATEENGVTLCASIEKMVYLESLHIHATTEKEIIALEGIQSPPQFLRHLYLLGHLNRLPKWITKLQNLVKIEICHSKLKQEQLKVLKILPYLSELQIFSDAYNGEELLLEKGCFPKLYLLKLQHLSSLNSLIIEKGAMPYLEELHIGPCDQLKEAPKGIQHLEKLKRLEFYNMTNEFVKSMYDKLESNRNLRIPKISMIPEVYFHYQIDGESFHTSTFPHSDQKEEHLQEKVHQPSSPQVKPEVTGMHVTSSSGHEDSNLDVIPQPPNPPRPPNRLKEIVPPHNQNDMNAAANIGIYMRRSL